jgi:hypothetical protein
MKSVAFNGLPDAPNGPVRHFVLALVLAFCGLPLQSATLERLTLTDMAVKSTTVVRGTVLSSAAAFSGGLIFTHYQVQVSDTLKGHASGVIDVAVPGGVANGVRQAVSGAPEFQTGDEYVFFLWTGKSGVTQVIGLTQGLFRVTGKGDDPALSRRSSHELMLDARTHHPVQDQTVEMRLSQLRSVISNSLGATK